MQRIWGLFVRVIDRTAPEASRLPDLPAWPLPCSQLACGRDEHARRVCDAGARPLTSRRRDGHRLRPSNCFSAPT